MGKDNAADELAKDTKLNAGVTQYFVPGNVSVTIAGVTMAPAQVGATLETRIAATHASTTAKANLSQTVAARKATMVATQPVVDAVTQIALIMYANQPDVLTTFGIVPKKVPVPLTVAQKADRQAKIEATRLARGTMGPKAKAKVKGVVAPAAPAAGAASPAPALPSGSTPAVK